jgi:hypothetical protein
MAEDPAIGRHEIDLGRRVDDHRPRRKFVQFLSIDLAVINQGSGVNDVHRERCIQSLTQFLVIQSDAIAVDREECRAEKKDDDKHRAGQLVMQVLHALRRLSATIFIL